MKKLEVKVAKKNTPKKIAVKKAKSKNQKVKQDIYKPRLQTRYKDKVLPDLKNRWVYLEQALWQMGFYPQSNLKAIRSRLAELINAPDAFKRYYSAKTPSVDTAIADQFVFDVRSISSTQRNQIIEEYGRNGLLNLMICLALYDGIYRVAAVLTSR